MAAGGAPAAVKLIVAEVFLEWLEPYDVLEILPKPEGTTWYPDARVFVRTREGTPRWLRRYGSRVRASAIYLGRRSTPLARSRT
jgi:hypothetical protein